MKRSFALRLCFAAGLAYSVTAGANIPSVELDQRVPGTGVQPVEPIPDKSQLGLMINTFLLNEKMNVPGWDASTPNGPDKNKVIDAFGVRTTAPGYTPRSGDPVYYVGQGVGRSGVWEKSAPGDQYAIVGGRPLKGLTIKGYGGNVAVAPSRQQQPEGSLDFAEAYRDTVLSKIFMEFDIDTYIGAFTVKRPKDQANFIRLSRSTLRMNDLIDRNGSELRATVDHLSDLLVDEVGKKMSPEEFAEWLVQRTARTLAGKEYIKMRHGSQNSSNIGIAELVDHGEGSYDPSRYSDADSKRQLESFKRDVLSAAEKIAKEFGFSRNFTQAFESSYQKRYGEMQARDASRVQLDKAGESELKKIKLSDALIREILVRNAETAFGILVLDDVLRLPQVTESDRKILLEKGGTTFTRMPDQRFLPNAIIEELGGARGVRTVLNVTLDEVLSKGLSTSNEAEIKRMLQANVEAHLKSIGKEIAVTSGRDRFGGSSGPKTVEHLMNHMGEFIKWAEKNEPQLLDRKSMRSRSKCAPLFAAS